MALLSGKTVVAVAFLVLMGALPATLGQSTSVDYLILMTCPGANGISVSSTQTTSNCPVRATDPEDSMGDPSLAVDPFQPNDYIIASLHGSGDNPGAPSVKSRSGQDFTTFTSDDAGYTWTDKPFTPPSEVGSGSYGEHPSITIDPYGHVYVGSLYSTPTGTDGIFDYVIAAQKFTSLTDIVQNQGSEFGGGAGDYHAQYLDPVHEGNIINNFWFLFNPITDNMTMVWSESLGPSRNGPPPPPPCEDDLAHTTVGDYYLIQGGTNTPQIWQESNGKPDLQTDLTCPTEPDTLVSPFAAPAAVQAAAALPSHLMPALPQGLRIGRMAGNETGNQTSSSNSTSPSPSSSAPPPPPPADKGNVTPMGVIGVVWTDASVGGGYFYQDTADAIGPCKGSTNPVLSEGWLYVGCVADPTQGTFRWHPGTLPGTVELFRMNPDGGKPEYMGASPLSGSNPRLGVRSDGRLALVSASGADNNLRLDTVFGHYDPENHAIRWGAVNSLGDKIQKADPGVKVLAAQVQDLIYREQSGVIHIILKQIVEPSGVGVTAIQAAAGPHIRKSIVAVDETYGFLQQLKVDIGNPLNRTDTTLLSQSEMVFNDLSDDFLQLPPFPMSWGPRSLGDDYQREFFAMGDYGTIVFGEVIEITTLRAPGIPPPPSPPLPVPAPALAPAGTLAPVAGLSAAGVTAGVLAASARKSHTMSKR